MTPSSILLFVHTPFLKIGHNIFFDKQALNGLRLWAGHFDVVRMMAPMEVLQDERPWPGTIEISDFCSENPNIEFIMLPRAGIRGFVKDYRSGKAEIRDKIAASQYLVFGFSGYIGDWGTIACQTARQMGRPYAVFKDAVGYRKLTIKLGKEQSFFLAGPVNALRVAMMKHSDRKVVQGSALALLHGRDTFDYYGGLAPNPQLVHDIHISKSERITQAGLEERLSQRRNRPLNVVYAGRVEDIKAPDHWVSAFVGALGKGIALRATWFGTGAMRDEQMKRVAEMRLEDILDFAGWVEHSDIMVRMRQEGDMFVFTHMTEESPRCLIEALAAGLPLVGYDSAYPRDLIGSKNAGIFVERGNIQALQDAITVLANDPDRLDEMSRAARDAAAPFNDEDVFRERCQIIKSYL